MKHLNFVRNSRKNNDFGIFSLQKSRYLSKFSKLLILVKTLKKNPILVNFFENLDFGQVIGNFDCGQKNF